MRNPFDKNIEHKNTLSNLRAVVSKGYLAIDPRFDKLLTSMMTAWAKELTVDKEQTSYDEFRHSQTLT